MENAHLPFDGLTVLSRIEGLTALSKAEGLRYLLLPESLCESFEFLKPHPLRVVPTGEEGVVVIKRFGCNVVP